MLVNTEGAAAALCGGVCAFGSGGAIVWKLSFDCGAVSAIAQSGGGGAVACMLDLVCGTASSSSVDSTMALRIRGAAEAMANILRSEDGVAVSSCLEAGGWGSAKNLLQWCVDNTRVETVQGDAVANCARNTVVTACEIVQLLCSRGSVDGDSGGLSALLNNLCQLMDGEKCIACPAIRAISEVLRNLSVEESKKALLRLKGLLMSEDAEVSCVAAHS